MYYAKYTNIHYKAPSAVKPQPFMEIKYKHLQKLWAHKYNT